MKNTLKFATVITIITLAACKKEETPAPVNPSPSGYTSMNDFYAQNGVPLQTYSIDGTSGGSFTTPQGTVVTIPPNAFVTQSYVPVTGNVTIEFKDIYKKSDMVLSDKTTGSYWGWPLKSAGEFFFRAVSGSNTVIINPGKKISVAQPALLTGIADTSMKPFVLIPDSANNQGGWANSYYDTLLISATNYVYNMYYSQNPVNNGTWYNSDSPSYFSSALQTTLTLHSNDPINYQTDIFLVYKNVNSGVHVYGNGTDFIYQYAPQGLQCTVVAVGVKGGKLYSSFVPITIGTNQTVNFSLTETTTVDFKTQLETLN